MKPKEPLKIATNGDNKKIYFGENGKKSEQAATKPEISENKEKVKPEKKKWKKDFRKESEGLGTKWYQVYDEYNTNEQIDIKDSDLRMFEEHCKKSFNDQLEEFKNSKVKIILTLIFY